MGDLAVTRYRIAHKMGVFWPQYRWCFLWLGFVARNGATVGYQTLGEACGYIDQYVQRMEANEQYAAKQRALRARPTVIHPYPPKSA